MLYPNPPNSENSFCTPYFLDRTCHIFQSFEAACNTTNLHFLSFLVPTKEFLFYSPNFQIFLDKTARGIYNISSTV